MPITNTTVALSTAAASLFGNTSGENQPIVVQADVAWYMGGPSVTTSTGISVAANERVVVDMAPGDKLYGILAASTGTARVMKTRA